MKVNFFATLRYIAGKKTVEIQMNPGATAGNVLDAIVTEFPLMKKELLNEEGRMHGHVHFFVNGRDIQFTEKEMETVIEPDDIVNVFPAVGGG